MNGVPDKVCKGACLRQEAMRPANKMNLINRAGFIKSLTNMCFKCFVRPAIVEANIKPGTGLTGDDVVSGIPDMNVAEL